MTRMWSGVEPSEMCDQHLLGEHSELHQVVGTLKNHPHGQAVIKGHIRKGQVMIVDVPTRHSLIADEMGSRGMNHKSPLTWEDIGDAIPDIDERVRLFTTPTPGWGEIQGQSRKELSDRCEDCRRSMR